MPPDQRLPASRKLREAEWETVTYRFLESQQWNPLGATLLLAVSGGADSIAMLHFWARSAASKYNCTLHVAHINHGLRFDALTDEHFVVSLCRQLKVPCEVLRLNPKDKPVRESTEMWARRERYRFFSESAEKAGATWILTGHHRDDLVETIFQRLGRGTGPRGLAGIPFRREPGIIRPFLNRSRKEILSYLELGGIAWREDESNQDIRINRNWYRHRYLPGLRKREPDLDDRIFALAMRMQSLGKGIDALEEEAGLLAWDAEGQPYLGRNGISERVEGQDGESLAYWLDALLRKTFPAIRHRSVTKVILEEFCRQWRNDPSRLKVDAHGVIAFKSENNGVYCLETAPMADKPDSLAKKSGQWEPQKVILDGTVSVVAWSWDGRHYHLSMNRYSKPPDLTFPAASEGRAIFDADLFSCTLLIRTRLDGDCFSPFGVNSRNRKLKTFLNEKKVPVGMRDKTPIILSDETLAWIPGYGISDFLKVTDSTSFILELVLTCENP